MCMVMMSMLASYREAQAVGPGSTAKGWGRYLIRHGLLYLLIDK